MQFYFINDMDKACPNIYNSWTSFFPYDKQFQGTFDQ